MGKIFCIMGKSGAGKDTIFKELNNDSSLSLKPIVGYTTRPKRDNEINGVEYYFINESQLDKFEHEGKIIEKRVYNTLKGKWCYATIDDNQIDLNNNNYMTIVTLEAYNNLSKYFGSRKVIPIYIDLDDGVRLERALAREREQNNPNYNEMCRRFIADNNDFSKEKLEESNIDVIYNNYDLYECLQDIKKDIIKHM